MQFTSRFIVVFLALLSVAFAGERDGNSDGSRETSFLFPTDASRRINSGFADYRATHFHGGVDISTNGRIGYPVYAAKSGYVYCVSVSAFGYGKRIILRHDDSTFTLYAHLSAFVGEIEKRVKEAQQSEGKYNVDLRFRPGEIEVSRGEVIARTGASGVGGPHLHFEIHGSDYSFIDPLTYKSLDVTGYRAPRIFNVAVRGFFSGKAHVSRVTKMKNGYRARTEFRMDEPFFFVIHAADSYDRGRFKRPPKFIDLVIDGREFISMNLTRFNADEYFDVSSLVDTRLSHRYKTYFRLCVDRAIPFSVFRPSAPLSGLVYGLSSGTHDYTITVRDEDGDSARVTGRFALDVKNENWASGFPGNGSFAIEPFKGRVVSPIPGLTLSFSDNTFVRNADLEVDSLSSTSFSIRTEGRSPRKHVLVTWKVGDPRIQLYWRGRRSWIHIPSRNDGRILTARIGYETGEFALIRDNTPPVVRRIMVSRRNPFYRSVAPTEFNRDFVYFKVFDKLSNINTDNILLKVGTQRFLCEYDADKHAAVCRVDDELLRREGKVEVIVHDNAGNERTVVSSIRL